MTNIEDPMITATVKSAMVADPRVSALNISVETNKGVVSLVGNVNTPEAASAAMEIASSIADVVDVNASQLKIEETGSAGVSALVADMMITAKVKGRFLREKIFGDQPISVIDIQVETKNGVVYLSGTVGEGAKVDTAQTLARSVEGVKSVESNIKIKSEQEA